MCKQAASNDYKYAWADTCCINTKSDTERSEAINSMYRWYKKSAVCYVYMGDVPPGSSTEPASSFGSSSWFTRGWTLQELVAPSKVDFFAKSWAFLGTKATLSLTVDLTTEGAGDRPVKKKVKYRWERRYD